MLRKISYRCSEGSRKAVNKMAEKIQLMKETMNKTTPKAFSLILMISTVPSFWFINQILNTEYAEETFTQFCNRSIKYYYAKNLVMFMSGLCLLKINYTHPSSKYTIQRGNIKYMPVCFYLSLLGICLPSCDNKHIVWLGLMTDISALLIDIQMASQGIIPFWFYTFKHYIRYFDLIIFIIVYFALKKHSERRQSHPHQFIKQK